MQILSSLFIFYYSFFCLFSFIVMGQNSFCLVTMKHNVKCGHNRLYLFFPTLEKVDCETKLGDEMMSEPTKTKRFKTIYKNDDVIEKIERYIYVYRLSTFTQQDEALASQFWDFREPIFFPQNRKIQTVIREYF